MLRSDLKEWQIHDAQRGEGFHSGAWIFLEAAHRAICGLCSEAEGAFEIAALQIPHPDTEGLGWFNSVSREIAQ